MLEQSLGMLGQEAAVFDKHPDTIANAREQKPLRVRPACFLTAAPTCRNVCNEAANAKQRNLVSALSRSTKFVYTSASESFHLTQNIILRWAPRRALDLLEARSTLPRAACALPAAARLRAGRRPRDETRRWR